MEFYRNHSEARVFFHIGKYPVGYTLLAAILLTISMLVSTAIGPMNAALWLEFRTVSPLAQSWWRIATQAFFIAPSLSSIIQLIMLSYFGQKLEQSMTPRDFLTLLLFLWLAPALLALAVSPLGHSAWQGCGMISLGLFLAFVCHWPNMPSYFGIPLKWFGVIVLTADTLNNIAFRSWPHLLVHSLLWLAVWWWMRRQGYSLPWRIAADIGLPWPSKKSPRARNTTPPKLRPRTTVPLHSSSAVDRILDKVSREGIHSLTAKERQLLQDTSDELKK